MIPERPMMLHLVLSEDWVAAQRDRRYLLSTRGRTLSEVGFVHLARPEQVGVVLDTHFADRVGAAHGAEVLLLALDDRRLGAPVRDEAGFPHLYGELPIAAVSQTLSVRRPGQRVVLEPVQGRRLPLAAPALAVGLAELPRWSGDTTAIVASVTAGSFRAAVALVDRVAGVAEQLDHHPDIDIRWRTVSFRLSTHSAGGVTALDLDLAARIDDLAVQG
jgi:4a-hydroxytetrahydrobiopterin dehydratase